MRTTGFALPLLFVCVILFTNGCTGWLSRAMVSGPNTGKVIDPADDPQAEVLEKLGIDQQFRIDVGPPAASLAVWVIDPPGEPRGTVICLHGINSSKNQSLAMGKILAAGGYRAVLVDLRSHGYSSGGWITFGVHESTDLVQVTDALEARGLLREPLGVYGTSYGASVGIQYAAADPRVRAVVAVAPFASLRDVTPGMVRQCGPLLLKLFMTNAAIQKAITQAGAMADFDPDQADAVTAIQRTNAPVLLAHGSDDTHIRPVHSERLHQAALSHSKLMIVKGRNHGSIMRDANVQGAARAWFDQWLMGVEARNQHGATTHAD